MSKKTKENAENIGKSIDGELGAKVFSDPYAPVELKPMSAGDEDINKMAVMVKDDAGVFRCSGVVSPNYDLITNEVARDLAHDVMTRSPMDWEPFEKRDNGSRIALGYQWNGKRFGMTFWTTEPVFTAGKGSLERPAHLGLMIRNSYDGSHTFHIEHCLCFQRCYNQFINRHRFGSFVIRHTQVGGKRSWDVEDAVQQISLASERLLELAPVFDKMQAEPIDVMDLKRFAQEKIVPDSKWPVVLAGIEEPTKWGLLQALTHVGTHELAGRSSYKMLEAIGEHFVTPGQEVQA